MADIYPPSVEEQSFQSIEDFPKNSKCMIFNTPFSFNELNAVFNLIFPQTWVSLILFYYFFTSPPYLNSFLSIFNDLLDEDLFSEF